MLFGGCRIVHAQCADIAFPVEDQLTAVKVHSEICRVGLPHHAKGERRPLDEGGHAGRFSAMAQYEVYDAIRRMCR